MFKKVILIVFLISVYTAVNYGESLSSFTTQYFETDQQATLVKTYTPHLWSDFKVLAIDPELCSMKGKNILESLSFKSISRNLKYDKAKYVYGNFNDNRASITCAKLEDKTFVYTSVAGPDVELVQKLRNEIVWQL